MNRDNSVSMCRAVAIICMVAGHSWINSPIEVVVNLWDMTLFYFVSGYCFKTKYFSNAIDFLRNRIKGLWVPYVKWGVISVLLHNIFLKIGLYSVDIDGTTIQQWNLNEILYRIAGCLIFGNGPDGFLGGYWFLKDMFFAVLLSFTTLWLLRHVKSASLIGGGIVLILSLLRIRYQIAIPYVHTSTLLSASIFCIGNYCKQEDLIVRIAKNRGYTNCIVVVCLVLLFFGYFVYPLSMSSLNIEVGNLSNTIAFFVYSTLTSFAVLSLFNRLTSNYETGKFVRALVFIGNNTLPILTFHMLAFKLINYVIYKVYDLPLYTIGLFPTNIAYASKGWWIVYTIAGIVIPSVIVIITKSDKK